MLQLFYFLYKASQSPASHQMPRVLQREFNEALPQWMESGEDVPLDHQYDWIREICHLLWAVNHPPPSSTNPYPDLTIRFIIHTQVLPDGSLKKPQEVTGIFAKMCYNMVCRYYAALTPSSLTNYLASVLFGVLSQCLHLC